MNLLIYLVLLVVVTDVSSGKNLKTILQFEEKLL